MKAGKKTITKMLIPEKMIYNGKVHQITGLESKYIIRQYVVKTIDKKIDTVYLNSVHPNCDQNTKQFCIPNILRNHKFNRESQLILENILITFNLDDCYFKPWNDISYVRI